MSNEVKKENKSSVMNAVLKSTVAKLAILAGTAMSMSSCVTTVLTDSNGNQVRLDSYGMSAGQAIQTLAVGGNIATNNHAISKLKAGTIIPDVIPEVIPEVIIDNNRDHVYYSTCQGHSCDNAPTQTVHCHGAVYYSMYGNKCK